MSRQINQPSDLPPRVFTVRCTDCRTALARLDDSCASCGVERPREGWPNLADGVDPWLGRGLGERYVLRRLIGRGATGNVYIAESPRSGDRYAAKMINFSHPDLQQAGRAFRERITAEIKLLTRVRSPHVVKFVDLLEPTPTDYAVITTLVEGRSLEDLIDQEGPLRTRRSAEIARQVAIGMAEVHRLGAVHRDLKPDNILVQSLRGDQEFVYIIDFGIVRMQTSVRETIGFIGTPLYASPEQAMGRDVGTPSDIYSLGAVLFNMLTGEPPLQARTAVDVLARQVRDASPRLSEVMPERDWPEEIEDLVARMLAKDPDERPASMDEVAAHLSGFLWAETKPHGFDAVEMSAGPRDALTDPRHHRRNRAGQTANLTPKSGKFPNDAHTPPPAARPFIPTAAWAVSSDGRSVWVDQTGAVRLTSELAPPDSEVLWSPGVSVTALAFCGDHILVGLVDGTATRIAAWDHRRNEPIFRDPTLAPITSLGGSQSGRILVVAGGEGRVRCSVDDDSWEQLPDGPPVTAVAADDATGCVAVGCRDGATTLYQPYHHGHWETETVFIHDGCPNALSFSPDGYLLGACVDDTSFELFDAASGRLHSSTGGCRLSAATVFSRSPLACCGAPERLETCPHLTF